MPESMRQLLLEELSESETQLVAPLSARDVHDRDDLLELGDLLQIALLDVPDLRDAPYAPVVPAAFRDGRNMFDVIRERDVLVHHPYESFSSSVEAFLEAASSDPQVLAIKLTLYRTSGDTAIVRALTEAAEAGKQVAVIIELQARFERLRGIRRAHVHQPRQRVRAIERTLRSAHDLDLRYEVAMMSEKLGRLDEMEKLLRSIIAAKPDFQHAYNALGFSLADRNLRLPEARELIVKALEFAPEDPYIVDSLGWVEFRMGNKLSALAILERAYANRPDVEIAAHLGEVHWSLGQQDKAKKIWREAMRIDQSNELLQQTLKRLKVKL